MKKTIVLIILAVYIASIAVVNFFGLEVRIFDGITYVAAVQCDTVTFHGDNSKVLTPTQYTGKNHDTPQFVFDFIPPPAGTEYTADPESINANPNVVQINYEILPHLADITEVKYEYDKESGVAVYNEQYGYFIFLKPNRALTVTIRAIDGSNVSTTIIIKGKYVENTNTPGATN